jgi:hypothetical protein
MTAPTTIAPRPQRNLMTQARSRINKPAVFRVWFPLSVFVVSRLITAAYMLAATSPAHRRYGDLATAWDGDWYRLIATTGYPSSLPIGADGQVAQNAWAFSPGYPLIVRTLMAVTGLDFSVLAPALSLIFGAAAMVVLFILMDRAVGHFYARAWVILACTFMAAPVLQLAYAEGLALLLLAGALLSLRERRYVAVAVLLLALALTRPVVLAFIPVVIAHGVSRWRGRASDPFPARDRRAVAYLTSWCILATVLWPGIVAARTGDVFAWTRTQDAWRVGSHFPPGVGWPAAFLSQYGWPALTTLTVVMLLGLGIALRPGAKAWGPELRTWSVAYPAYLLMATVPVPSMIRWMVLALPLMWPFPEPAATAGERRFRIILIAGLAVLGLVLQWVWVSTFLGAAAPSYRYP